MAMNLNSAFARLQHALEEFHAAALTHEDPDAPAVVHAANVLADAYTIYDDALFRQCGVEAPFDTFDDFDEDDLDDDFDDEDDDLFDEDDDFDDDEDDDFNDEEDDDFYDDDDEEDDEL